MQRLANHACIQDAYLTFHASTILASAYTILESLYCLKSTSSMHSTDQGHESRLGKHIVPLAFQCNRVAAILCWVRERKKKSLVNFEYRWGCVCMNESSKKHNSTPCLIRWTGAPGKWRQLILSRSLINFTYLSKCDVLHYQVQTSPTYEPFKVHRYSKTSICSKIKAVIRRHAPREYISGDNRPCWKFTPQKHNAVFTINWYRFTHSPWLQTVKTTFTIYHSHMPWDLISSVMPLSRQHIRTSVCSLLGQAYCREVKASLYHVCHCHSYPSYS